MEVCGPFLDLDQVEQIWSSIIRRSLFAVFQIIINIDPRKFLVVMGMPLPKPFRRQIHVKCHIGLAPVQVLTLLPDSSDFGFDFGGLG